MKPFTLIAPILLAASLATVTLATAQQSPPPAPQGERGDAGPDHGPDHGPGRGMPPQHGPKLTEAQEDKLFALEHAAEPARRERDKAMRHAEDALREMADSGKFDDAKAAALAQAIGQAAAAEALDHARSQAQFLAILTPEQRTKMQQERAQHGPGKHP